MHLRVLRMRILERRSAHVKKVVSLPDAAGVWIIL